MIKIKVLQNRIALIALILMTGFAGFAQNGKYGATPEDSVSCVENLSLYIEFYKQKNYQDALAGWRLVFKNCPKSSKKMYANGANMYKRFLRKEKDPVVKEKLIDTLLMIYDQRIKNFGQEGFVLGQKGVDLIQFRKDDLENIYSILEKSVKLQGKKSKAGALTAYFQAAVRMLDKEKIEKEKVIEIFVLVTGHMEYQLSKITDEKKRSFYVTGKQNVETLFEPIASCEDLVKMYSAKFEANKNNVDWLKRATGMMDKKQCTDDPIFVKLAETLHNLEPSAESAYNIGKMLIGKKQYSKATLFLKQAVMLQDDNTKKADYQLMLANHTFKNMNQLSQARTYALQAASSRSGWGDPYLAIGDMYAASAKECGTNEFEVSAVYWIAVDQYVKAKSVDGAVAEKANKKIATWSKYFPNTKDAFFYNFTDGKEYKVGCWINGVTTVRVQ